ncbi:RAS2 protein [Ophidiomyces ophidiicola]|uniref:RAS2 protein n=1 Tax=Ophidiomyces ophidiicola TaxID=1387563 RepID=A0ACB8UPX5_9EURO|nr:RAS2 protein [Ophidiomyces ophidiicola]KAI1906311.1 RAS2 protein [Ophidiomyces ophidiicola]KAI1916255.1 RAS2 protein [Ophidiomyces ophidiicola]KAI1920123.1 RAS2 protein [Ophidiomyces ophidiicola]KAI1932730.1 RAS2 protein [Ophidiomyces ophidiicola]KAI1938326.1 RAS2 protein [Ophidiomyces ophidiicola]
MTGKMKLYKLVVLGDGGVGKTALTIQLCLNHFVETYDPTIEDSYRKQVVIDQQLCMLEVLDTAGQEEYTSLRDQWIRDGEGFVLVYSITSRSSFTSIQKFYHQIQLVKESTSSGSPTASGAGGGYLSAQMNGAHHAGLAAAPVPVMLVGNKCDKAADRAVSSQEGHALAKELGCDFVETSAKNCVNVEKAFFDVVRALRQQRQHQQLQQSQHSTRNLDRRGTGYGAACAPTGVEYSRSFRNDRKGTRSGLKCAIL